MSYYEPRLVLNFAPINLSSDTIVAYQSTYDESTFRKLQNDNPNTFFYRDGSTVFAIPLNNSSKVFGDEVILNLRDNYNVFSKLISDTIIQAYAKSNVRFTKLLEPQFIDLSRNLASDLDSGLKGISIYPKYQFEVKKIGKSKRQLGILTDVSTKIELTHPVSEILKEVDVVGLYVETRKVENKGRFNVHWNELQGRIQAVKDAELLLKDYKTNDRLLSNEAYLEPSKVNVKSLISQLFKFNAKRELAKIDQKIFETCGGLGRYKAIISQFEYLNSLGTIHVTDSLDLTVNSKPTEIGNSFIKKEPLDYQFFKRPTFVFDPTRLKTHAFQSGGLIDYGPFDSETFKKKNPRFVVVVPSHLKTEVEAFLNYFKNGEPSKYFTKGFVGKYVLNSLSMDYASFAVDEKNVAESYRKTCLEITQNKTYDLAIIIIEESFRSFTGNSDPYLVAKSVLMSQGIPVQEVEIETIRQSGRPYSLDNIALACYAKLGGTPWTISSPSLANDELVIGLGSATLRQTRLSPTARYVGITAVFGSDGNYLFSNLSKEAEYEDYQPQLTEGLKQVIAEIAERHGWKNNQTLRLIFHQRFKKYNKVDIQAIKNAIEETGYPAEFAFVTIGQQHPFDIFNTNQSSSKNASPKGEFVPERGYFVQNSNNSALLTVIGPGQLVTSKQAFPKPLLVSVHRDSTFDDLQYLTKQVYDFTSLSWRAFNPTNVPVTIQYSDLIAELLGKLRSVKNWNSDILYTKLRDNRWFL